MSPLSQSHLPGLKQTALKDDLETQEANPKSQMLVFLKSCTSSWSGKGLNDSGPFPVKAMSARDMELKLPLTVAVGLDLGELSLDGKNASLLESSISIPHL